MTRHYLPISIVAALMIAAMIYWRLREPIDRLVRLGGTMAGGHRAAHAHHQHVPRRNDPPVLRRDAADRTSPLLGQPLSSAAGRRGGSFLRQLLRTAKVCAPLPAAEDIERALPIVAAARQASANLVVLGDKAIVFGPSGQCFLISRFGRKLDRAR